MVGFGLYFFSKYILTIGLEVFSPEESESNEVTVILHVLNDIVKLTSTLVFVYAYCKYLGTPTHIKATLYMFFFIRNLFLTNMWGFVHKYDIEIFAPMIDVLFPCIIIYSLLNFFVLRQRALQHDYVNN
jgi:hypothetical protein